MKIALGADERLPVVEHILQRLAERGHQVQWYGPQAGESHPGRQWPAR